jgi:hypothetical protein
MSDPMHPRTLALAALLACAALVPLVSRARADPGDQRPSSHKDELGHRPPGPPPEAFEACSEKQEGESCTVELRDRTLSGSCLQAREQEALFCLPDELPPPPPGRP